MAINASANVITFFIKLIIKCYKKRLLCKRTLRIGLVGDDGNMIGA